MAMVRSYRGRGGRGGGGAAIPVGVGAVGAKLGLDRRRMDAVGVQALTRHAGELHVSLAVGLRDVEGELHVHRRDDLGVGQLPDVHVMAAHDARERLNVLADLVEVDVFGRGLEEDLGCRHGERDARVENDEGDEERDDRVGVVLARPVGEPDDQSGNNDAHVAQRVAEDVQDHGVHAHVAVVMAVLLAGLLGLVVVVRVVDARAPTLAFLRCLSDRDGAGFIATFQERRVLVSIIGLVLLVSNIVDPAVDYG
jgi:hypothetical protein